jgi:3-oxoacyl-[acyl-carrier protein] reductase
MAISDTALEGRVALVTGASRGIGRAIALALARRGAKVLVNYASREDAAQETVAAIEALGKEAQAVGFDVSESERVSSEIKRLGKEHGRLDIVVNNAGVAINGMIMRFKDEQLHRIMAINLAGAFAVSRAAVPLLLRAKEHGRIINVSSVVGEIGNPGQVAYATTKAGLIGMTKALAKELASRGVTVNAVAPGFIATDMTDEHLPPAERERLVASIPLKRIGSAEDVAQAVAFLAGPEAGYITGAVIRINGGLHM